MKRSIWTDEYEKLRVALRDVRKGQKLTQHELANLLDKPRTYVTKYEIGDRNLDFVEVIKVCVACDVDPLLFISEYLQNTK